MGDFTMPSLGADMEAGTLVEWRVKPGDRVKRGDIVAVVETQKGAIDVEIFEEGRIDALLVEPGTQVPVGAVLARVVDGESKASAEVKAPVPVSAAPVAPVQPVERRPAPVAPSAARPRQAASPAARVAARELGVDLERVEATGPGGAITREDVERAAAVTAVQPQRQVRPGMRQAIAAAMSRSKREIPHYYLSSRIDVSALEDWRARHNEPLKPAARVLQLVPLLKAIALALRKVPELNGFFVEGAFRAGPGIHLGIAVSLREGGLIVPAVKDADRRAIDPLNADVSELIERARRGQLRSSELSDSTLTVTSLGERGVDEVFGVIFPPQVAIVGLGKVVEAPCVVGGRVEPRRMITATLAADHRVSDGHRGALFLAELGALLQHPEAL